MADSEEIKLIKKLNYFYIKRGNFTQEIWNILLTLKEIWCNIREVELYFTRLTNDISDIKFGQGHTSSVRLKLDVLLKQENEAE